MTTRQTDRWLIASGISLAALGYAALFFFGLQWHHFVDRPSFANGVQTILWDRYFVWFFTAVGLFSLLRAVKGIQHDWYGWMRIGGKLLQGAGLFIMFDGILFHLTMNWHHVRVHSDLNQMMFEDLLWVGMGLLITGAGIGLHRAQRIAMVIDRSKRDNPVANRNAL